MGEPQRWKDGRGRPKGATAKWLRIRAEARRAGGAVWEAWIAKHPGGLPTPQERSAATKAKARRGRGRARGGGGAGVTPGAGGVSQSGSPGGAAPPESPSPLRHGVPLSPSTDPLCLPSWPAAMADVMALREFVVRGGE